MSAKSKRKLANRPLATITDAQFTEIRQWLHEVREAFRAGAITTAEMIDLGGGESVRQQLRHYRSCVAAIDFADSQLDHAIARNQKARKERTDGADRHAAKRQ